MLEFLKTVSDLKVLSSEGILLTLRKPMGARISSQVLELVRILKGEVSFWLR